MRKCEKINKAETNGYSISKIAVSLPSVVKRCKLLIFAIRLNSSQIDIERLH